jgi:hypothetical protein
MAASYSVNGEYGVGTSNINIFGPVAAGLEYGDHYVYWRESQYVYKLVHSPGLSFDGSRFLADHVSVVTYQTSMGYGSQATFLQSEESNFSLSPGSYLVWSDLGDYPVLYERGEVDYAYAACFGLAVCFVLYLVKSVFRSLRG